MGLTNKNKKIFHEGAVHRGTEPLTGDQLNKILDNGLKDHICPDPENHVHCIVLRCVPCSCQTVLAQYRSGLLFLNCSNCGDQVACIVVRENRIQ